MYTRRDRNEKMGSMGGGSGYDRFLTACEEEGAPSADSTALWEVPLPLHRAPCAVRKRFLCIGGSAFCCLPALS